MTDFYLWISVACAFVCAFASWAALISIAIALKKHEAAMNKHQEFLREQKQ